jgi:hypothetical protein
MDATFIPAVLVENASAYGYGYGLTPKGEFLQNMLLHFPEDWEIGGMSVRSFLRMKLSVSSGSSYYGESKSKSIINKCDNGDKPKKSSVQTNRNTTASNTYKPRSEESSNSSSNTGVPHPKAFWGTFLGAMFAIGFFVEGIVALGVVGVIIAIIFTIYAFMDN